MKGIYNLFLNFGAFTIRSILGPLWVPTWHGSILVPRILQNLPKKSIPRCIKLLIDFGIDFFIDFWSIWEANLGPKSIKNRSKIDDKKWSNKWSIFLSIFGRSGSPTGAQLGTTWAQKGRTWQLRSRDSKEDQKRIDLGNEVCVGMRQGRTLCRSFKIL